MLAKQLQHAIFLFARSADRLGTAITTSGIKKGKRGDIQLSQLKHALMKKEPVKSASLYDQYHHRDIYKRIDTDLQAFFYKREYTLENFNFLINLLGHQKKMDLIPQVLHKMDLLKIAPDDRTYNYIIKAAADERNVQQAELYYKQAVQRFGESIYFYNSLMQAYVSRDDPTMAYKILQQMIEKGIEPNLPVYTTLINAFRMGRKLQKCWQINKMLVLKKVQLDETYVGVMLKVHAATHDAQKAVKLYQQVIIANKIKPMLQTTNSYFKALATRPDYAVRVVDQFFNMVEMGQIVNEETVRWALKAASTNANVKSAIQIIMQLKGIEPSKQIYNSLIRVYAKACDIPDLSDSYRDMMITDTWKILEEVIAKGMLDTHIVNNVMLVYANSMMEDKLQGLILPLYQKFNLQMNPYSYEILVELSYRKKDFNKALRVWQQMKTHLEQKKQREVQEHGFYKSSLETLKEDLRPTFQLLELYIQMGIRLMNMHMILEALEMFKAIKRHPKNSTLKFLGTLKNLPVQLQIRFGAAKLAKTRSTSEKHVKDPQNM